MSKVIGIDLGTTNSCVAVVEGGRPVVIPNAEGERTTPSVVAFTKDGERLVGGTAKRQMATNPGRTVASIKRRMGSDARMHIDGHDFTPQEISAMILTKLRRDAEAYLGEPVSDAVITVPAYFDDSQRKATQDAGRIAGLNVLRIINEPTAAAVAYGLDNEAPQKILVYDLGGGTFDVSIIEIENGTFTVLATGGDTHLGGDDFDERIVEHLVQEFKKSDRIDLAKDPAALGRLREEAEKAKKELSAAASAEINLPFIAVGRDGPHHLDVTLTRAQFELMTGDLLARTVQPVETALRDSGLSPRDLARVLLVGGSTRMPAVERKVREVLGVTPSKNLNPDECVAMGAAVQGGLLQGGGKLVGATGQASRGLVLMDVTPLTLSIETLGGIATPLIIHWPRGIADRNAFRHDLCHVIDFVPTLIDLAGGTPTPPPGAPPFPGHSLVPAFARDGAASHDCLFFNHDGNRALRVGDYKLVSARQDSNVWELYNIAVDRGEQHNLAAQQPERVQAMAARWQALNAQYIKDAGPVIPLPSAKNGNKKVRVASDD